MESVTYRLARGGNRKLGKSSSVWVSYASRASCPARCPLRGAGCYADYLQGRAWDRCAMQWREFILAVASIPRGQFFRASVAGDLPGDGERLNRTACLQLARAARGLRAWSYSHYCARGRRNADTLRAMRGEGFNVHPSCESIAECASLRDAGLDPVLVSDAPLESFPFPAMECPGHCITCGRCWYRMADGPTVVFRTHGAGARKVREACARANA